MAPQKGKQGTKGQKQIVEENSETLKFYLQMALIANGIYYALALTVLNDCFTWFNILMLLIASATYVACYQFMAYISVAKYTDGGQLIDSGVDLNMEGGLSEHVKDLIILTSAVQVLSLLSNYFWLLWLAAPGRAIHLAWANILSPYFFQQAPPQEIDEKKQRKMERRMKRGH
ncbi:transmembrane protein 208 [Macrosteles quadrilineatus]|uniref:transmembrane protein 208 n=1 Tax=Macrosteles quadrilineatus TaxID=74068 RepID=UPI0023E34208|nr:transmembrane protein 208 [Macrosteles quadrilineatus]